MGRQLERCVLLSLVCGCGADGPSPESGAALAGAATSVAGNAAGGGANTSSGGVNSKGGAVNGGGRPNGGEPGTPPAGACPKLAFEEDVLAAGRQTDRFSWSDSKCRPRTAALARVGGGYLRQLTYEMDGAERVVSATDANGHPGWGFSVNHELPNATVSHGRPGEFGALFVGTHHAIYEYTYDVIPNLKVTLHWFFASGRSHPALAINYDMTKVAKGIGADSRTPYGDIAWDGDENASSTVVSGVGWGDRYKFVTTKSPLTMDSTWDYTEPNSVPYVLEWADAHDAEMGAVQTQTYLQKDAGGYWFFNNWGKTSANQIKNAGQIGNMPVTWNWTYQLNQYELCIESPACLNNTTGSHRLAWGMNYGAIGGADASGQYQAFGDDKKLSGWPYQSYSVFMVLDQHSKSPVFTQVSEVETVQKTTLSATVGSVLSMVPGGVGRQDLVASDPPGYDQRYSTWNVQAADNQATLQVTVAGGSLENPVLVVSGFTSDALPTITIDGVQGTQDSSFLASLLPARQELWITFRPGWSGTQEVVIK